MTSNGNDTGAGPSTSGAKKTRVRAGHRAHLTKLFNEITTKLGDVDGNRDSIVTLRACLDRKAGTLSKLDEEILEEVGDDAQMLTEIEGAETIQNSIQEQLMKIDKALKPDVDTKPVGRSSEKLHMKMPKFECSTFHGDPKKWIAFRDSFNVSVSTRDISDVEKFNYLRMYLKGEALRAIDGLAVTNENYSEAYEILEKRFGNKQIIVNSHMEELCNIDDVTDDDDTKGLRRLYDTVEVNLRSLRALKVDPQQYGTLLVPIIKKSLPGEVVLLLSRKFDSNLDLWVLDDLMNELRLEIEARERCFHDNGGIWDSGGAVKKETSRRKKLPNTGETLLSQNDKNKLKCVYCGKPHYPDQCRIVTDTVQRKLILQEKKRCYICTNGGHNASQCKSKKKCYLCKGKHHTSLCDESKKDEDVGEKSEDNNEETTLVADDTTMVESKESKPLYNTTLLGTALVNIVNPKSGKSVKTRIVFDNCSQRTYASKRLQDALQVERTDIDKGQSTGVFGGGSTAAKNRDIIVVGVSKGRSATMFVKAVVVDEICSPVHGQAVDVAQKQYDHLYGLQLADEPAHGPVQIDRLGILLGLSLWCCYQRNGWTSCDGIKTWIYSLRTVKELELHCQHTPGEYTYH